MHIAESPPPPPPVRFTTSVSIVDQLFAAGSVLATDVSRHDVLRVISKYDEGSKGGLSEEEWRTMCAENPQLFLRGLQATTTRIVDFGRVSEIDVGGTAPAVSLHNSPNRFASLTAQIITLIEGFIAGGLAGAVSKSVIAPGDRVKIIFQVNPEKVFSWPAALKEAQGIVKQGGVTALWLGNGATMMRVVPYASITFMSFERYHWALRIVILGNVHPVAGEDQRKAVSARFFSGALAGATATACTYPLDLMRARFAAASGPTHASYVAAFRAAHAAEGWKGLYSGLRPTLIGIMPYAGSSFACFETVKHYLVHWQNLKSEKEIPAYQRLIAGGFAGLTAQSLTYPLDIVRRRMQVTPHKYISIFDALTNIYRVEGLKQGLYKGLTMNWIKGPIAVATSFTINDIIKGRIHTYNEATSQKLRSAGEGEAGNSSARNRHRISFAESFACGAVAGFVSKLWTVPFDRLKLMYVVMLQGNEKGSISLGSLRKMKSLYLDMKNPWQGSGAMMIRVVPYAALTYSCFDRWQPVAERALYSQHPSFATNFVAGAMAASVSTFVLYPLDLMRFRQATAQGVSPIYTSYYLGMAEIARTGGVSSLWTGACKSMLGVFPMAGCGFALYEYFKETFKADTFFTRLGCGAAAGCVAQAITYPLHVARRQHAFTAQQTQETLRKLYANKGYSALYQRMPFGRTLGAATVGLSFSVFDNCCDAVVMARRELSLNYFSLVAPSAVATPND